jgi:mRNA interferase MazF
VAGPHPVVILTVNRIAAPLSAVTVVLVTGSAGPDVTHIRIGPDAGVTRYPESYVNCADLHTVDKPRLRRRLGRLAIVEMRSVESAIRRTLGL